MNLARTALPLLVLLSACDAAAPSQSTFRAAEAGSGTLSITLGGDDPMVVVDATVAAEIFEKIGEYGDAPAELASLDADDERLLRVRVPGLGAVPALFETGELSLHVGILEGDDAQSVTLTTSAPVTSFEISHDVDSGVTTDVALARDGDGDQWTLEEAPALEVGWCPVEHFCGVDGENLTYVHIETGVSDSGAVEGCGGDVDGVAHGVTVLAWARVDGESNSRIDVVIPPACEDFVHERLDEEGGFDDFAIEVGDGVHVMRLSLGPANDVTFKRGVLHATAALVELTDA